MPLKAQEKSIFHLNGKWLHRNGSSHWSSMKDKSSVGLLEIIQTDCPTPPKKEKAVSAEFKLKEHPLLDRAWANVFPSENEIQI